jgi:PPOX class probable F420-dependent enzyme
MLNKYHDLLFDKLSFANVAIVRSNGRPHVSPVWFDLSEEDFQKNIININTAKGRVKARNMEVGSQVAITILDPDNPYRYLGIDGEIIETIEGEAAERHIDALAKKYLDKDVYPNRKEGEERIKIRIKINNIHDR